MKHSNSRQQQTNLRTQEDGRLNLMAALHPEHDQVLFWSDSRRAQRWLLTSTYFVVNKPSNTRLRNQEQTFSDKFSSRYISLWLSWSYSDRRPGETLHIHIFKYRSNIKPIHKKNKTFMPTNPRVEFCLNMFIAGPERRAEHRSAPHPVVCRNTRPQTARLRVSACGATLQLRCFQLSSQEEAERRRRRRRAERDAEGYFCPDAEI